LLDGRLVLGLAVVAPYGAQRHWNGDGPMRYFATDSRVRIVDVSPAAAWRFSEEFSAGAGFDYVNAFDVDLRRKVDTAQLNGDLTLAGTGNAAAARGAA